LKTFGDKQREHYLAITAYQRNTLISTLKSASGDLIIGLLRDCSLRCILG